MHAGYRGEDSICVESSMMCSALEFEREHIEQHFRIRVGIDVPKVELEELAFQRLAVSQVAVMCQRDAEWRVDIEGLRFQVRPGRSCRRIAAMTDSCVARKLTHVARPENVPYVTRALVHVEHRALAGHDAG